ncbi:bZIP transcription factor [Nitzschia inconspicua]|uniref:BZIP transcription factor n=1 Tax=Nitzschia inconspicua TaxID=303405 RepID=A0A9K3L375_9STRA|nr:bZIP transcription factor [Nitzschia inconspicua]
MTAEDPSKDGAEFPTVESSASTEPKAISELTNGNAAPTGNGVMDESNRGGEGEDDDEDESDGPTGAPGSMDAARAQKKRKERLEQNRISARESRKRKKTMIEELQRTVITLSKENKDLNDRNEHLRSQLMEIGRKYPNVVPIQTIMNGAPPPAPQPPPGSSTAAFAQQQLTGFPAAPTGLFAPQATNPQLDGTASAPAVAAPTEGSAPPAPSS